jgi:hypothetical protein
MDKCCLARAPQKQDDADLPPAFLFKGTVLD